MVDQDLLDRIAATVADLYRDVEAALVHTVAEQLRKDPDDEGEPATVAAYMARLDAVRKLQASARLILAALQEKRATVIREAVAKAYRSGTDAAVADLPERWFPRSGVGQQARAATRVAPNARLLENIAQALHRDVGRVDQNILRAPVDAYRAVQAGTAARIASGSYTRREASQAAWQRLMDRGIVDFTDRANRRWKLSSYVEMMARTNIQRAATQGQTDRLAEIGIDLVYVSDNSQECKLCRPFEGKVLRRDAGPVGKIRVEHATRDGVMVTVDVLDTLDGARAKGLFHPNCRHSASAYLPGVTKLKKNTADPDGDRARQRQRALERRIRAAKEAELGALTPAAKKEAAARVRAAQAALRAHLKANPKLKRLPYREQIGAGNIPPAGGPRGGPITDLTPPTPTALPVPAAPARPAAATPARGPVRRPTAAAARYHRNLDGIEDLADLVESGPPAQRRPLGGGAVADVELLTFPGGRRVVRKSVRPGSGGTQEAASEQLASLVARKLGLPAPAVYRNSGDAIFMEHVDGRTAQEIMGWNGDLTRELRAAIGSDDGLKLGLLDLLTFNWDRNSGNWMIDRRGRLVPIDHGVAWQEMPDAPTEELIGFITSDFADRVTGRTNPFTKADIADVRRRLQELRPDFEHLGRGEWLDYAHRVLDWIEERAAGDRNIISGVR